MMGLTITDVDPQIRPGRQLDFLGIKAAEVLSDIVPGVKIIRGPSTRAMLASIDGAAYINRTRELLACGAIIASRQSCTEGARSATARGLSNKGFDYQC